MKAIRVHQFGGPEQLKLEEIPNLQPAPGQLLIKVHAAGVNPFETYQRTGSYAVKPALPYTPGADGAGVILKNGAGAQRFQPGQRVYMAGSVSGTYAEQALCQEAQVRPLPEKISFEQGAAMGVPYCTAYRALFQKANALPGETVVVHGASGGVGIAALQLARAHGMTVIGTASTAEGRELVKQNGAHSVLNHSQTDVPEAVKKLTGGHGADVILEMLANKNLAQDLNMIAIRGRVIVIGNRGTIEINPRDTMLRDVAVLGFTMWNASETDLATIHSALVAALESGVARPVIGKKIPLAEAARAHEEIMQPGSYGKIVLVP